MAHFKQPLNSDEFTNLTAAVYDAEVGQWMHLTRNYVQTAGGLWVPQKCADDGTIFTQLTGSSGEQDLRGLAANKPDANTVIIGTTYWSVDTGDIEVSDGANWVVV